ncbi:head-tail adaptor protein [Telmatobacter bradus]|uniref:head-tail adaptor protein n=1 Tax=Telmatobacter bradus TaxID=474953 RepID=UPI003B42FA94
MAKNSIPARRDPLVIDAGELRHAVSVQSPVYAAGACGMSVTPTEWAPVRSAYAAIYTAGGRETSMAAQIVSQVSHVVKLRWTADVIKANFCVIFGDRTFIVQYVENVLERNRVLLLYCLEVDGGGQ